MRSSSVVYDGIKSLAGIGIAGGAFHKVSFVTGGSGCNWALANFGDTQQIAKTAPATCNARERILKRHVHRLTLG